MAAPRESTLLPTIKCSQCSHQVEISMMGEHICGGPTAESSPPPKSHEQFSGMKRAEKYGRLPPPVDTSMANQTYSQRGPLTPLSHSGDSLYNRANGRLTPGDDNGPSQRVGIHKPSLSPMSIKRPGGYGGFGDQEPPRSGPSLSPSTPKLLDRMNTMATGPFDPSQRPWTSGTSAPTGKEPGDPSTWPIVSEITNRPSTSHSTRSTGNGSGAFGSKVTRKNGYGGFGPPPSRPSDDLVRPPLAPPMPLNRSDTYSGPLHVSEPLNKSPSVPETRSEHRRQKSSYSYGANGRPLPEPSRAPPPRKSLFRSPASQETMVDLAAEFGARNPCHTPSDSTSSGYSSFDQPSNPSSHTSPARSHDPRQPSDSRMQGSTGEVQNFMHYLGTKKPGPVPIPAQPHAQAAMTYPGSRLPPMGGDRPTRGWPQGGHGMPLRQYDQFSSSPHPHAPQMSRDEYYGRQPPFPTGIPGRQGPSPPSDRGPFPPHKDSPLSNRRPSPPRKDSAPPYRGDCKACGSPIHGKSISSADGRLTGKYHKPCFVCTTCSQPFTSAEFYVLDDRPYCEVHYHQLNGSLCRGCGHGIEGQYAEDEALVKYHVGCFCCPDCGISLADGYFEIEGRSYCEHDAYRRADALQNAQKYHSPGGMTSEHDAWAHQGPPQGRPMPPRIPNGLPSHPGAGPGPGFGPRPSQGRGGPRPPYGVPQNGMRPGVPPNPTSRLNKRMTRIGRM